MSLKVRLFGSHNCPQCKKITDLFVLIGTPYDFIDAFDDSDEIQDFCDEQNVGDLPHLQVLDDDQVVYEAIDTEIDMEDLLTQFPELSDNNEEV